MLKHRQVQAARILATLAVSLSLLAASGCSRDPNVRKHKYLESGMRYETAGKYKEAVIQFSNAVKVDGDFADAHYELAKTYMKMKSLTQAFVEFQKTVALDKGNLDARINLGNLFLAGRSTDQAEAQVKAVLAVNPNYADAYALRAAIDQKNKQDDQALQDIQHALALDPKRPGFHSSLALLEAGAPGKEGDAEQELQKASSLDPKDPTPHILLASLLERTNDMQGAERELLAAKTVAPENFQARAALAGLYLHVGDKDKAEQTLRQATVDLQDNYMAPQMLAEYYARTGQLDHAAGVFQDLNAKFPKNENIKLNYARVLFAKKDYAKATTVTDELVKTDPGSAELQVLSARLLLNTGKTGDALTLLKKSVRDNPSNMQALILLAQVEASTGDMANAESTYRQAAKLNPSNLDAAAGLAEIAMGRGDEGMLSEIADTTIKAHPQLGTGYLWRGIAEGMHKEYDKAAADFEALLKSEPNNSLVYVELGLARIAQGRAAEGRTLLQTALDKDPNSVQALNHLVALDLQAKQMDKAIARVQAQIAKVPGNGQYYTDLADLQSRNKDYKGELESARKAMQINPSDARALQFYSQAEVSLGDVDSALSAQQGWVNAHPNDANGLQILGSLEEAKGDDSKAMEDYKKALQINPENAMASNNLAYLMVENSDSIENPNRNTLDVALTLAQTARRLIPDRPETADTLAWVYFYQENYAAARDLLESALQTYPNDASINLHLGMVYAKLNDKSNAQIHLKKAATLAPNTKIGKDASAELDKLG